MEKKEKNIPAHITAINMDNMCLGNGAGYGSWLVAD